MLSLSSDAGRRVEVAAADVPFHVPQTPGDRFDRMSITLGLSDGAGSRVEVAVVDVACGMLLSRRR
jgi:hypothetical protein